MTSWLDFSGPLTIPLAMVEAPGPHLAFFRRSRSIGTRFRLQYDLEQRNLGGLFEL